jgi:hypothetical protein
VLSALSTQAAEPKSRTLTELSDHRSGPGAGPGIRVDGRDSSLTSQSAYFQAVPRLSPQLSLSSSSCAQNIHWRVAHIGHYHFRAVTQNSGSARGSQAIFVPSTALASRGYNGQPAVYLYIAALEVNVLNCRVLSIAWALTRIKA